MFPSFDEQLGEIVGVIYIESRLHNHIVHVDLKHTTDLRYRHLIHHSLICCIGIFEVKVHKLVAVISLVGHECSFLLVNQVHRYLVYTPSTHP